MKEVEWGFLLSVVGSGLHWAQVCTRALPIRDGLGTVAGPVLAVNTGVSKHLCQVFAKLTLEARKVA